VLVEPDADRVASMDGQELVRVSDSEREAVVERLNVATSEGRLTLEEFGDRVTDALAARTRGDLDKLVGDLPATGARTSAPASAVSAVGRVSQITPIGSVKRRGRWRIDRDMEIGTQIGSIKLDLRQAEIAASQVELHVRAVIGSVKVWIPRGVAVEVDGQTVLGSRSVHEESPQPFAPVLRLRIDTVIGSVKVYRV
jgi:DUF1707 SHOCT-like domain/Cell wall-active antibiotics response LiaF, C-terminal